MPGHSNLLASPHRSPANWLSRRKRSSSSCARSHQDMRHMCTRRLRQAARHGTLGRTLAQSLMEHLRRYAAKVYYLS